MRSAGPGALGLSPRAAGGATHASIKPHHRGLKRLFMDNSDLYSIIMIAGGLAGSRRSSSPYGAAENAPTTLGYYSAIPQRQRAGRASGRDSRRRPRQGRS